MYLTSKYEYKKINIHIDQAWETGKWFWNSSTEIVLTQCPSWSPKLDTSGHYKRKIDAKTPYLQELKLSKITKWIGNFTS